MASPWEQRPDESSRDFGLFARYLDLGPSRTLVALASLREVGVGLRSLQLIARRHSWRSRADAWDRHVALEAAKEAGEAAVRAEAELRAKVRDELLAGVLEAVAALRHVCAEGTDAARVRAACELLDRSGVVAPAEKDKPEEPGLTLEDARRYLRDNGCT